MNICILHTYRTRKEKLPRSVTFEQQHQATYPNNPMTQEPKSHSLPIIIQLNPLGCQLSIKPDCRNTLGSWRGLQRSAKHRQPPSKPPPQQHQLNLTQANTYTWHHNHQPESFSLWPIIVRRLYRSMMKFFLYSGQIQNSGTYNFYTNREFMYGNGLSLVASLINNYN